MNGARERWQGQRGALLLSALVLLVVGSAMIAAMTRMTATHAVTSVDTYSGTQAVYLAESGLQIALKDIQDLNCACTGTACDMTETALGNGTVAYTVTPISGNDYTITAIGAVPNQASAIGMRTVSRKVNFTNPCTNTNIWDGDTGIYGCQGLTLSGSGEIKSNVKTSNANAPISLTGSKKVEGSVTTTGASSNITLSGSAKIEGDASSTGSVSTSGSSRVEGTTSQNQTATTTSTNCDPLGVTSLVSSKNPGGTPTAYSQGGSGTITYTDNSSTYNYSSFSLSGSKTLKFSGDKTFKMYVGGNFSISGSAEIKLENGAKLEIYVTGTTSISGSGGIEAESAADVSIYSSSSGSTSVSGSVEMKGSIYAPNSNISMTTSKEFTGGMRGKTVTFSGSGEFEFDDALNTGSGGTMGVTPSTWTEKFD